MSKAWNVQLIWTKEIIYHSVYNKRVTAIMNGHIAAVAAAYTFSIAGGRAYLMHATVGQLQTTFCTLKIQKKRPISHKNAKKQHFEGSD